MKSPRPSYRFKFGKFKGRTAAQTPRWYLRWAYKFADSLSEDERYVIAQYLETDYRPRRLPFRELSF